MKNYLFIIGSPRSGTTITGKILDAHPHISAWFVPYFIWERHHKHCRHDAYAPEDATPAVKDFIKREFAYFQKKTKADFVVDQSPRNSLRPRFVRSVFPQARFIHVIRDGRDVALSLKKEWQKNTTVLQAFKRLKENLDDQKLFRHKVQEILFEFDRFTLDPKKQHGRRRWGGRFGYGPRFPGWEEVIDSGDVHRICALQWLSCVRAVEQELENAPADVLHRMRYEDLLTDPQNTVQGLLDFIGCQADERFWQSLPKLKGGNFKKWQREFTPTQLEKITAIIQPELTRLGYV